MEQAVLQTIAQTVSTPGYVFDLDAFRQRVQLVKQSFGEDTGLCFSIKANPFLLKNLPRELDRIEVCSPGELAICEALGIDMSRVIFSGVNKTREDIARAMEDGVGVFTAESILHMRYINGCAAQRGKTVPVLLRLTAGSQFGMSEEDILQIIRNRETYPNTQIIGLHFFSGTQKRKSAAIVKELDSLMNFTERVQQELSFRLDCLEYGTGLAVDYFTGDAETLEQRRLEDISEKIREVSRKVRLTVEMGRFFCAPCGWYFTKVMDTKSSNGIHYAILDGGLHQLKYDGQIQGMQIPCITHFPAAQNRPAGENAHWTLCGSLCTTADVLARNAVFSGLSQGDVLAFSRTGAYSVTEGMALFLSRDLPEVSVYSAQDGLVRLRERISTDRFQLPTAVAGRLLP